MGGRCQLRGLGGLRGGEGVRVRVEGMGEGSVGGLPGLRHGLR